jgi:hypothetical protein
MKGGNPFRDEPLAVSDQRSAISDQPSAEERLLAAS